jgi:hypothetical protein
MSAGSSCGNRFCAIRHRTCGGWISTVSRLETANLKILQRLGVNIYEIAPVLAILDTHLIARNLLGANSVFLNGAAPMTSFNLGALLAELKCPYERSRTFTTLGTNAMLMLAIKSSESRELGSVEREKLDRLRALTQVELYECQRWKPIRSALGFHAPHLPVIGTRMLRTIRAIDCTLYRRLGLRGNLVWKDEADRYSRGPCYSIYFG